MKYQALRGTKDILPEETAIWQAVENLVHTTFQKSGFSEIRTPAIEMTELFTRTIGDGTDIVSKEMYSFKDKGDRDVSLRPEATASVVRAVIENGLIDNGRTAKLYYIGPMFRYERPQAGRQRQFYQAGIESIGSDSYLADAEVILAGLELFDTIGIKSLEVEINSVGCPVCRPGFVNTLKETLEKHLNDLCDDCKERFGKNPLRLLDCKNGECRTVLEKLPPLRKHVCDDCSANLEKIEQILRNVGVAVKRNDKLVRGLDYYTGTIFEIISNELGAQNAVCGGGRYDNLIEQLGGKPTPAVGLAVGMERLVSIIGAQKLKIAEKVKPAVYIICQDTDSQKKAFEILIGMRKNGIFAEMDFSRRSMKAQMKTADGLGAGHVLIIGAEEIKKGSFPLKNMTTGEQKELSESELERYFQ